MKKIWSGLVVVFVLFSTEKIFSDSDDYMPVSSGFAFGVRGSWTHWEGKKTFTGYGIGPSVAVDYRKPWFVYGGGRFYYTYGSLENDTCHNRHTNMLNLEGRIGFTLGKMFLFTPYTGIGYISSDLKQKGLAELCSKTVYTNIYVPVGLLVTYHFSDQISLGIDYEYMPTVDSSARVAEFKNVRWTLEHEGSHNVEIPFQFMYPRPRFRNVQYRLTPFFRTYNYGFGSIECSNSSSARITRQKAYEIGLKYEVVIF